MMPYLGNVGQVFCLEVHCVPFIVKFPFGLPVCQHPKNFGIIGDFVEPIIGFGVNWLKVIIFIDRPRIEVYLNPAHPCGRLNWLIILVPPLWQPALGIGKALSTPCLL